MSKFCVATNLIGDEMNMTIIDAENELDAVVKALTTEDLPTKQWSNDELNSIMKTWKGLDDEDEEDDPVSFDLDELVEAAMDQEVSVGVLAV